MRVKEKITLLTKRGILHRTHSNFDPLGFSSVVLLERKLIFQDLCSCSNFGWDDPIPEKYVKQWEKWLDSLVHLPCVTFLRCFTDLTSESKVELHIFCDASICAYGVVVYLLVKPGNNVSFILGKSQVISRKKRLWQGTCCIHHWYEASCTSP